MFRHQLLDEVLVVRAPNSPLQLRPVDRWLIVDAICGAAVLRGSDIYAPGVLATPAYIDVGDSVSVYADLEGKCLRGRTQPYTGATYFVGNGVMNVSRKDIFCSNHPRGLAVRMSESLWLNPSLGPFCESSGTDDVSGYSRGLLQNLPSALVARVLAPRSGDLVLDMCAAPGGKATHLAQLLNDRGVVYAYDRSAARVRRMCAMIKRLGICSIVTGVADGTQLCNDHSRCCLRDRCKGSLENGTLNIPNCPEHGMSTCIAPFAPETFDCILLDAPCSALGQRPQLVVSCHVDPNNYQRLQRRLLSTAVKLLAPGGRLVYCTCTVTPAENEQNVAWLLDGGIMQLVDATPRMAAGGVLGEGLSEHQASLVQRFASTNDSLSIDETCSMNNCDGDTIGFFIAKFVKKC